MLPLWTTILNIQDATLPGTPAKVASLIDKGTGKEKPFYYSHDIPTRELFLIAGKKKNIKT